MWYGYMFDMNICIINVMELCDVNVCVRKVCIIYIVWEEHLRLSVQDVNI